MPERPLFRALAHETSRLARRADALAFSRSVAPSATGSPGRARALLVACALLGLAACEPHVDGNGVFREETRNVGAFEGISVDDRITAIVVVGGTQSVKVSGDENVVEYIETNVVSDEATGASVLHVDVSFLESWTSTHPLRVVATTPALRVIRAADHSSVTASGVRAEVLHVEGREGSTVEVEGLGSGPNARLVATVAGRSDDTQVPWELDAHLYPIADADVELSEGARIIVKASDSVSGTAPAGTKVSNTGDGACLVTNGAGAAVSCAP